MSEVRYQMSDIRYQGSDSLRVNASDQFNKTWIVAQRIETWINCYVGDPYFTQLKHFFEILERFIFISSLSVINRPVKSISSYLLKSLDPLNQDAAPPGRLKSGFENLDRKSTRLNSSHGYI